MKKDKIVTALLSIFGGGIGLQFFYLGNDATIFGKKGKGITYGVVSILFCWTTIPAIVGIIQGVLMLTMTDAEFSEKYGVEVANLFNGDEKHASYGSAADEIAKYKKLYDDGAISAEEYNAKKEELLKK
jgi:hypothetical protein